VTDARGVERRSAADGGDVPARVVRTLDALHLAIADRRDVQVLTADAVMSRSGAHYGMSVELLQAE